MTLVATNICHFSENIPLKDSCPSHFYAHLIIVSPHSIYLRHCWGPPHASCRIYANVLYSGMSFSHCVTETLLTEECSYSWRKKWNELLSPWTCSNLLDSGHCSKICQIWGLFSVLFHRPLHMWKILYKILSYVVL